MESWEVEATAAASCEVVLWSEPSEQRTPMWSSLEPLKPQTDVTWLPDGHAIFSAEAIEQHVMGRLLDFVAGCVTRPPESSRWCR